MPQSYKEYPSGSVTLTDVTYAVPFKYLSIDDVNVIGFDGDSWTPLALDASAPRNATNKTVTLATAPNALYTKIRLYRASSTTQLVDFQNGSRLSESDLDTAYQQGLFAAQEVAEDASTSQFAAVRQVALQAGTSLSNFKSQEFTGDGTALFNITAFAPATVVKEAYRVSIDGVMQAPSDYTVSMSPAKITFTSAPPTGSKIVVVTAASAASAVSVDDVTIGLTSTNKAQVKDGGITQDKLSTGAPRWNTNGQLFVDGVDTNGDGNKSAGIEINSNLTGGNGYAYLDFHSRHGTNPDYDARIYNNTNGTFLLENKTNGRDIILQTTNSSGTTSNALQVDGEQNVIVGGNIEGSGAVKITRGSTVYPNDHTGGLVQLANNTSASAIKLSIDPNEILASDGLTIRAANGHQLNLAQNNADGASSPVTNRLTVQTDGKVVTGSTSISDITDAKQITTKEYVDAQLGNAMAVIANSGSSARSGGNYYFRNLDVLSDAQNIVNESSGDISFTSTGKYLVEVSGALLDTDTTTNGGYDTYDPIFTNGTSATTNLVQMGTYGATHRSGFNGEKFGTILTWFHMSMVRTVSNTSTDKLAIYANPASSADDDEWESTVNIKITKLS